MPGFAFVTNVTCTAGGAKYSGLMSFDAVPVPTYKKAVLQSVAYKRLREVANRELKTFHINTTQWLILGILFDKPGDHKVSNIARDLQVEVPLITTLAHPLMMSGFVEQHADRKDRRSKPLSITQEGIDLMNLIEDRLAGPLEKLETGLSEADIRHYLATLQALIDNADTIERP